MRCKSQIVEQVAADLDLSFLDVRAVQLDPVDLRGLPRIAADQTEWAPPKFLPTSGKGILFLDELTSAPQMTQAGCYQLVLDWNPKMIGVLDEPRIETLARQHGIRQKRDEGGIAKTLLAFMRRADEGTLSRLTVEATILLAASRHNGTTVLKEAATLYKVDAEAIGQKVRQEFAAKARAKKESPEPVAKPAAKIKKAV